MNSRRHGYGVGCGKMKLKRGSQRPGPDKIGRIFQHTPRL